MKEYIIEIEERFNSELEAMANREADHLLVAVSGGVDSMTLLKLMVESGYKIAVAHCNFGLRGEDSDADARLVADFCNGRNIVLHSQKFDTQQIMKDRGVSLQVCARDIRYEWFKRLCEQHGYSKVAIAHNSGDRVETFLINLIRGTGLRGLIGIPETRDNIIRPLMWCSRENIVKYAKEIGVVWRDDASNASDKYLRNKLRHHILPVLNDIEPKFEEIMGETTRKISEANQFIESMISQIRDKATNLYRGKITVSLRVIEPYGNMEFVLFELLAPMGFSRTDCDNIVECYKTSNETKIFESSDSYRALLSRGLLVIESLSQTEDKKDIVGVIDSVDEPYSIADIVLKFELFERDMLLNIPRSSAIAMVDAESIKLPLTVRHWQHGDSFIPLGMRGRKKLSDYFVDTKVSVVDKERQLLLCNADGEIIWIIGKRGDDRYKVTDETKYVLNIAVESI